MMAKSKYKDFPFEKVCAVAEEKAKDGWQVHQKFTCANCGQRLTMAEPNHFFETGDCDQCGTITDIRKQGCNYLLMGKFNG